MPCEAFLWWTLQAAILVVRLLNCHGNPCHTLGLAMKVEILNAVNKGDVLWANRQCCYCAFSLNGSLGNSKCSLAPVGLILTGPHIS